ncbi:LOW QUALITY PROTEIN: hypothetical protein CFC21_068561 [Triticum aestivum]|uniref:BTB domain-containing protein n=2 Tax=Triticum aestivum TaxID=4565 RepID=A0A3B6KSY7_WHEAT|nr:LOW QUALITY PROTEIN: hypothetical protein CFC21_068561 [Triticum aestivum]
MVKSKDDRYSSGDRSGRGGLTASAIVAPAVSGSHVLKIEGYSRTKGLGNGKCIVSRTSAVGGRRWYIQYFPNDSGTDAADWISIFICLHDDDTNEVKASYKINLLDQGGNPVPSYGFASQACYTSFKEQGPQVCYNLISRKDLEESVYLKDDIFSVRCDITIPKEIFTEPIQLFVMVPPSDVHQHLGRLLLAGDGADITFKVGRDTFSAHRCVLAARSSVSRAELFGPMKEKTTTCVHIKDMEARVFKAMLHFIYSDSLPHIDDDDSIGMAQHLLVAADRYNLERLKLICVQKLCNNMDTSMAATTLALAEQHGCRGLKEMFKFLGSASNILKAVMASDGFEHLRSSCLSVLKELVAKLAP